MLQEPNTLPEGHPRYPRREGESLLDYIRRLSEALLGESRQLREVPRLPYRDDPEPEEAREPGSDGQAEADALPSRA